MPSTYSTNLKLQLMATGEDSGTWGVNTNNNLGTLIEESIVGADTISMVDANQTITIPDGVTGSGRKVYLNCTGVLTANRNLVVPTANKNYVVTNSTTGGFSIVVKTTAGTGITIGPGLKRYVYADGTNVVEAINSVGDLTVAGTLGISSLSTPGNATIGGNLAVTGTTTLTGNATMGTVTGASFNKTAITAPATGSTLAIADGKTLTVNNTMTLISTDGSSINFSTYLPPGVWLPYGGTAAPSGWLLCDGSAVNRTTYSALFTAIGIAYGAGNGTTTFNVPDMRGRVVAGRDDMGGSAASRLTSTTMTPNGTTLAAVGGSQTHTLITAELAAHSHSVTDSGHTHSITQSGNTGSNVFIGGSGGGNSLWSLAAAATATNSNTTGITIQNAGSGSAHNNVQPTIIANYIIKA